MISALSSFPPVLLQQPRQVVFGCGCKSGAIEYLSDSPHQKLLLLASKSCIAAHPSFLRALEERFSKVFLETDIPAEPSVTDLQRLLEKHRQSGIEAVLAMGGGSVIDVAKFVAVLAGKRDPDIRALFGKNQISGRPLPLIALPTTSGAGSEVSPNAILFDEECGLKQAAISPHLVPDVAFVDPELTVSLPPYTTAATGLDALCHCVEAYTNIHAHPIVDTFALEGIRLISTHLVEAVKNGSNCDARSALSLGSLYGGLCLGPVNTAGVHALSYPLGSALRLAHGISNAVLLPHVFRYNLEANPERHAEIGRRIGLPPTHTLTLAQATADHFMHLIRACEIPASLSELGIDRSKIPSLATESMKVERLLRNNPRPIDAVAAEQIYLNAY